MQVKLYRYILSAYLGPFDTTCRCKADWSSTRFSQN